MKIEKELEMKRANFEMKRKMERDIKLQRMKMEESLKKMKEHRKNDK